MRVAILSDIHANLPAFEAVLEEIARHDVERIHCLGDIVGYGPFPNECVELVRTRCSIVIKGNHDSGATGETPLRSFSDHARKAIRWTMDHLTGESAEYLKQLPFTHVENHLTLVHASPDDPPAWNYVLTLRDAESAFASFTTDVCFIGHTHVPVVIGEDLSINTYTPRGRFIINVGSVGQPRDQNPAAAFGILDLDSRQYELVRVSYDVDRTQSAIRDAGLPQFLARRLSMGM
jgi:putative phosphoesterase